MNLLEYTPPPDLLAGRVILVTGSSAGIGAAVAVACARHGADVILHGRRKKSLQRIHDSITAAGYPPPTIAQLDFKTAQGEAYDELVDAIDSRYGRLDGILHNAGVLGELTPIEHYDIGRWQEVIHVNLTSAFVLTRCLMPLFKRSKDGSMVFTTSTVGHEGRAYWGAYAVSKFGVEGLAYTLAAELKERPELRVNLINPGATRTAMRQRAYPAENTDSLRRPDEIVPPYLWLLGPESTGTTGQLIEVQPKRKRDSVPVEPS